MKRLLQILLTCIVCCLTFSCKNFKTRKENLPTVLIFEDAPDWRLVYDDGSWRGNVSIPGDIVFLDENGAVFSFRIDREKEFDTLVIPPMNADYLELSSRHKSLNHLHFYIKTGDTIVFTYDDDRYPTLKSRTSDQLTQQYNFHRSIPSRISYHGLEPITVFTDVSFDYVYKAVQEGQVVPEFILKKNYFPMDTVEQQVISYLKEYVELLEQQYADKVLSKEAYHYHCYMLQYKQFEVELRDKKFSNIEELEHKFADFFMDDHSDYYSYLLMLDRFRRWYTSLGEFAKFSKTFGGGGGSWEDYPAVFDSFSLKTSLPPKTRNHILYLLFDEITQHFSVDDVLRYKERYIELTGDSIRAEKLLIERGIITQTNNDDIQLKDEKGNEITFETILKQLQGKVIYLDFWASWCAPCRSAMPEAFKLRKEYENKDVAFVYLAFNDREDAWKKAINDLQLNDNLAMNYFILNSKTSKTIQNLKVESIPRYLIYDKIGKIIYPKAPGPYGEEIRKMLDELLK
ncbi:MAG: redoxin family protein [Bacteroidales bacterium]|jgi:thiol-disulfide isomerase/thioredoxin|nr:redoxin family protein [Bacteroidales bacterium]